jgi:hypothetical protein
MPRPGPEIYISVDNGITIVHSQCKVNIWMKQIESNQCQFLQVPQGTHQIDELPKGFNLSINDKMSKWQGAKYCILDFWNLHQRYISLFLSASARISKGQGYQGFLRKRTGSSFGQKKGNLRCTRKNLKNGQNFTTFIIGSIKCFNTFKTL